MKRYAKGGDLSYWSRDRIKSFEFMQKLGVPQKDEMLKFMINVLSLKKVRPRFLEIGGGLGAFTKMILKKYPQANLVFLDGSPDMLFNAKRRLNKHRNQITFIQRDINDPDWHKEIQGSFDAVVSSWCLHYLSDARQEPFFKEIFHLLRPNGIFLFSCSIKIENKKFLDLYNELEHKRVLEIFNKQGIELTHDQMSTMGHKEHKDARINPASFDKYLMLMKGAGFTESGCIWKYLFNAVFQAYKGRT
jgi:tRNA (cmo5U34)-methyltransferase